MSDGVIASPLESRWIPRRHPVKTQRGNGHSCSFVGPSSILFAGGSPVASAAVWLVSPAAGFPRPVRPAARILNPGIRSVGHSPLSRLSTLFLAAHHLV